MLQDDKDYRCRLRGCGVQASGEDGIQRWREDEGNDRGEKGNFGKICSIYKTQSKCKIEGNIRIRG